MRAAISLVVIALACSNPPQSAGQDRSLRVPTGFHISIFAERLPGVRYLALGPGNAIYASQPASGLIVKLTDTNHDGVADTVETVSSGLHGPFGIAFRSDTMYVAEERDVIRFDPGARSCSDRTASSISPSDRRAISAMSAIRCARRSASSVVTARAAGSSRKDCATPSAWRSIRPRASCGAATMTATTSATTYRPSTSTSSRMAAITAGRSATCRANPIPSTDPPTARRSSRRRSRSRRTPPHSGWRSMPARSSRASIEAMRS